MTPGEEVPGANGSPSWKMIAVALVSLVVIILSAVFADARADITNQGAAIVGLNRELTEAKGEVRAMRADLTRIEALLIRIDQYQRRNP